MDDQSLVKRLQFNRAKKIMGFRVAHLLLVGCMCCFAIPGSSIRASVVESFESLKVLEMVLPQYPMKMTFGGVYKGSARVVISVDESGSITDVFQESFTHPEFGRLADKYIRLWTFQPAKLNGEPVPSIKPVDFNFDDKRGVFSLGLLEAVASSYNQARFPESKQVWKVKELDSSLQSIEMGHPPFPSEFINSKTQGEATVMFYIDELGKTRMPYVVEQSHPGFGQAALMAVERWTFEPPIRKGIPVSVQVSQTFNF